MIILLHSSKTIRATGISKAKPSNPQLINCASELASYLKTLSTDQIANAMHVSAPLAQKTHELMQDWSSNPPNQLPAIDSFVGDIYSGLRASELSTEDRNYANQTLRILSGLYGVLRPFDAIAPYRLEMGYKLPDPKYRNLYKFWGQKIADTLPLDDFFINTSSVEYSQAILPYVDPARIITPQFLSVSPKTSQPTFVVVHAKIARGAFARWLITSRLQDPSKFSQFSDLGYRYNPKLSSAVAPVYICQTFGGLGLSQRLL